MCPQIFGGREAYPFKVIHSKLIMGEQLFTDSDYHKMARIQVLEEDGAWRPATLYQHKQKQNHIVLYFGDSEYEGLDMPYHYGSQPRTVLDCDGDIVQTRRWEFLRQVNKWGGMQTISRMRTTPSVPTPVRLAASLEKSSVEVAVERYIDECVYKHDDARLWGLDVRVSGDGEVRRLLR